MNALDILWQYHVAFENGILVTLELVVGATVLGTILGTLLELATERVGASARSLADGAAFISAAIPALVLLFWLYYPAQTITGIYATPFATALAALAIMNAFSVYRIVADAVRSFPSQFVMTAQVTGMSSAQINRFIRIPLLIRASLPRWIDQQVVILQTSLFASLISVEEIFRTAQRINSVIYQPVAIYSAMAIVFVAAAGSAMLLAIRLRRRYERDFSER